MTLSPIFTRNIEQPVRKLKVKNDLTGCIFVIFLSFVGLALAYKLLTSILHIATQTFTGLAVLFPTVIFGLYLRCAFTAPVFSSILTGEGSLLLFYFNRIYKSLRLYLYFKSK